MKQMMRVGEPPVWRSMMFVPATSDRFIDSAPRRGADAIILDVEDSVIPAAKEAARGRLEGAARRAGAGGADIVVRINRPLALAVRDIEAAVFPGLTALALPKVDSAEHVRLLAEHVGACELARGMPHGSVRLIPMIETPGALFRVAEIAAADPRNAGIILGTEDFYTVTGLRPEGEGMLYPNQAVVFAATAAGILPLGFIGSVASFKDRDAFRAIVRRSRALGFLGAFCIHPDQVGILNEEFRPTPEEVAWAEKIEKAAAENESKGVGAYVVDGKMVDAPIVVRARDLLARARAIAARESRRS
jgi:citrate lyase subunit beta / citryl-CoA lyase